MRELVILSSSSIITPPNNNHHRHVSNHSRPKTKPSSLSTTTISTTAAAVHSRSPLRFNLSSRHSSLLSYYADLASKLAEEARFLEFSLVAESLVASGVEASHFLAALSLKSVSVGISKSLREGNVKSVVEVLRKVDSLGISPIKLLNDVSVDLIKEKCRGIVELEEVEVVVDFMEALAGFGFSVKELVEPSKVIAVCVKKQKPMVAVRYAAIFPDERILFCTIVNEFGRKRDFDSALIAYEASKQHLRANMYLYRTIIDICGFCGNHKKSREIYENMLDDKVIPNIYVFNSLMNVNANDLGYTLQLHKDMQNLGVTADVASYNILLKACCRAGRVDLAQDIYREMKQLESREILKLDDFTYCTIVKVFADAKLWQMALRIKDDMVSCGITPNTFTWSSLISACANAGLVERAIHLFEEMLLAGCEPNSQCCNILLHACVEACQYDRAFRLFQSWKEGESQWSMQNLESSSSHLIFLKKIPFVPTSTTYNILMKACGSDYLHAKSIIDEMKSAGISPNHISWSILMDICGCSGNVEGAIQILKNMHMTGVQPDVIAYTTAIKICVENKNLKLAFSLFAEMKGYRIKPNLVTYNTILRARTRYGSLEEIQQCLAIYQDMRKAGYKSNDYYLKQLIEEWCEGAIQENEQSQDGLGHRDGTGLRRLRSSVLEKVAIHLQTNNRDILAIDVQGLTKVEARIMVLAVLRMIKENHISGDRVKDDMWIRVGINEVNLHSTKQEPDVKSAILELLKSELGLEVQTIVPRVDLKLYMENHSDSGQDLAERLERNRKLVHRFRRPAVIERLKVTRKSLTEWLQRRAQTTRKV